MNLKSTALITVTLIGTVAHAQTLAAWNFNDAVAGSGGTLGSIPSAGASTGTGTYTTSANAGSISGNPSGIGSFAGSTLNAPAGEAAGQSLVIQGGSTTGNTDNNQSYVQFNTSTSGYQDVVFSYATRGTSTGFTTHTIAYSNDGVNFTDFAILGGRNVTTFSTQTVDLSGINALDDQQNVYVRITLSGASGQNGNNRFDNVRFDASPVPEPATMAVLGLGALVAIRRRRTAR